MSRRQVPGGVLLLAFLAYGCSEGPVGSAPEPLGDLAPDQPMEQFEPVGFTPAFSVSASSSGPVNIAGVGANFGFAAAGQICSSGDLSCTFTPVSAAAFNALTPAQLRAAYDVLIFTWVSSPTINADWTTRLVPYMNLGGGIIFEDPGNLSDLAPGVIAGFGFPCSGSGNHTVTATVPGLTDGIVSGLFANNHFCMTSWDPALSPFLEQTFVSPPNVTGLWGSFGSGCIVLTGPDQHFHANRGGPGFFGNQYNLLLNEVAFVTGLEGACALIEVDIDIKPGSDPNSIKLGSTGVIPVAILTTPAFDAADVDVSTVTLGNDDGNDTGVVVKKNGSFQASLEDVDGDGDLDLSLKFDQPSLEANGDLDGSSTELILNGATNGGQAIQGSDAVRVIP